MEMQEVPRPTAPPGGVLVRTSHSVISIGTEKMKIQQAKMNLLQKARARPDQVRKVLDTARTLGWRAALEKVRNRLESPTPLGYSAAGIVEEVDPANTRFRIGDRVACSGAECAFHAEYVAVPDFLVTPVPEGVENWQAAYTTLCAIALQAVRQTEPALGDRVLVMGQGLVGLLVTNLLHANGVRVMAVDVQPVRVSHFARAMGAERLVVQGEQKLSDEVRAWTDGFGVDAAIICTATQSNAPIEQAAEALRDRGRIVDVGITKIELPWKTFYEKEIDVRFSRSYGPGRYDPAYEWAGNDYPIGYVRWTEQRNLQACLHLMASGRIKLEELTTLRAPFNNALEVYRQLMEEGQRSEHAGKALPHVGVVLEYPFDGSAQKPKPRAGCLLDSPPQHIVLARRPSEPIGTVDVIGAGNFARSMLLPHLKGQIEFGTVVNQTALSANHVKVKFGFSEASTSSKDALASHSDRALLIATRHHLHAPLVTEGLAHDRHIFVEKPLCLTPEELRSIDAATGRSRGSVQVGFNRRFAPASTILRSQLSSVPGPKSLTYQVVAGSLDPSHWYANFAESGGRVVGEACHFLDYLCFLLGKPTRVFAQSTWPTGGRLAVDSVAIQVEFADGSCGQLIYSAEGDPKYPKEMVTIFGAGIIAEITNFLKLTVYRERKESSHSFRSKGHAEQMRAWAAFLKGNIDHPLPYEEARRSMLLTFAALESIQRATSIDLDHSGDGKAAEAILSNQAQ